MDKKTKKYILFITILVIGLVIVEMNRKKPVDWTPTFINTDKNPFGTYIAFDLLKDVFPNQNIKVTRKPVYNELNYVDSDTHNRKSGGKTINTCYIFINQAFGISSQYGMKESFGIDKLDMEHLFKFVDKGNNVLISAENISPLLLDTLGIEIETNWSTSDTIYNFTKLNKKKDYAFSGLRGAQSYFVTDSCKFRIKTLAESKNEHVPVFLQIDYGDGHIYLNSLPSAFSNIELLKSDKYEFAFTCLSYIPKTNEILWDEYQKQGRVGEYSTFRVIWNHPSLLYAYYIILAGGLLFMIFRSKRTQRIIPVINPPANTSLEFLNTISNLYYQKQAYESIVRKRHSYFLDTVRSKYYLRTETINDDFVKNLNLKSGVDINIIEQIFALHNQIENAYDVSNSLLLRYNNKLEEFYRNMK